MMRILMLNYEFPPLGGGAGVANWHLLHELEAYPNVQVDLVTAGVGKAQVTSFAENIRIHYLDIGKRAGEEHYQTNRDLLRYTWQALRKAQKLKQTHTYQCVHAFFGIPGGWIARRLNLPYIVSLRGSDVPFYNRRFALADRLLFKRLSLHIWKNAQFVVSNSVGLKQLAKASAPRQDISVIPNGVDTRYYQPDLNRKTGRKMQLLCVSRLIARKGIDDLLQAIKGMDYIRLVVAGDGNLRRELEGKASELQVNVRFAGRLHRDELRMLYRQSDAFVLPSYNEGMSNALLEALASGLPAIVTDVGGSAELVQDNGVVISPGDVEALRRAIRNLRDDPEKRAVMGGQSRKMAEQMSWARMAERYVALYEKCQTGFLQH